MIDGATLGAFVSVALLLLLTPGPAVAFVLARSLSGGPRAGLATQAGLCAGLLVHVAAATVGLSALLAESAAALTVLRWLGAAYLAGLGVAAWRPRDGQRRPGDPSERPAETAVPSTVRLFRDGFVVDVLNPKPALFFIALLPQFVDPARAPVSAQMALLGTLFVVLAFGTGSLYALLAGSLTGLLRRSPVARRWTRRATGTTYLALAGAALGLRR